MKIIADLNDEESKVMINVSKILPVTDNPPITVYRNYAYPLCIICSEEAEPNWLDNHFGNMYLMRNKNNFIWLDFLEPDEWYESILDYERITLDELDGLDIKELIKSTLNEGKYVALFLDGYYLNNTAPAGKRHTVGEFFIYGYDDEKEIFYSVGFNSSEFFGKMTYPYDEVIKASSSLVYEREKLGELPVWVLWYAFSKIKKKNVTNQINGSNIIKDLEEYTFASVMKEKLRSEVISGRGDNAIYGADCQKEIIKALYSIIDNGVYCTDYRHVHLLYEHKKSLFNRIKRLVNARNIEASDFIDKYQTVMKKIELAKVFYLKAIMSNPNYFLYDKLNNKDMIKKIIKFLEDASNIEAEVLRDLLTALKSGY